MPELPEVETIRRGLERCLIDKIITSVTVRAPKIFEGDPEQLVGERIKAIERFGKLLVFRLESNQVMSIHLKMTGQLIWKAAEHLEMKDEEDNATAPFEIADEQVEEEVVVGGHPEKAYLLPLPHKHTHVIFAFDDDSHLYFNDLRKFGRISLLSAQQLEEMPFLQKMGPEPLEEKFTEVYLREKLAARPKLVIKSFLLDQANIAGLGNIYVDESLFRAAILPDRLNADLKPGEIRNLYDAIQETLELALRYGGSSSKDYVNAVGERGTFLKIANVYHRQGQACNRCGAVIERKKIAGRSSHYCPVCQR